MNKPNIRAVLASNIKSLMAASETLDRQEKVAAKSGLAQATISRVQSMEFETGIDTIAALAKAFRLQPWQILVPGLDPERPPQLRGDTENEAVLYERLRVLRELLERAQEVIGSGPKSPSV